MRWKAVWSIVLFLFVVPIAARGESVEISPSTLGNIFLIPEKIEVPVLVRGAGRIEWEARNYFGDVIDRGITLISDEIAVIAPILPTPGWYAVNIEAFSGSQRVATGRTTVAVLTPLSDPARGWGFGVQTHFAQGWDIDILTLIAKAGIRHIRDEQYWATVEAEKGRFEFPQQYTDYMASLANANLDPLIGLTFENELYDEGNTPFTDEGRKGYARYGVEVLRQYGRQVSAVEVWNEFNGTWCKGRCREDRPLYYAALLKETYRTIKAIRPDVTVVGGSTVRIPFPYLARLFEYGALEYMDVLSIHPYGSTPDVVDRQIEKLRTLIKQYREYEIMPIWVTETSLQDFSPNGREAIARYLVQQYTALLGSGVERIYWYLLRDYYDFQTMGLLHDEKSPLGRYTPSPAYAAIANLIRQLGDAISSGREEFDPRTRVYRFRRGDDDCLVMWTVGDQPTSVEIETNATVTLIDMMGGSSEREPKNGEITLIVDQDPVYVFGNLGPARELRSDAVIALSVDDFSGVQSENGWYYGSHVASPNSPYRNETFVPLIWSNDEWSYFWQGRESPALRIGATGAHPASKESWPVWAIRRWRSNFDGEVIINGSFQKASSDGDGVGVLVMVDGSPVYSGEIGGEGASPSASFSIPWLIGVGSTVDFVVTPGPNNNIDFDATTLSAMIIDPKPAGLPN